MDNLAPEPGRGNDNVEFATIDWQNCTPQLLARHLFDAPPDGLAEEFGRQFYSGGYYVGPEVRQCYKEALEITIEGIKLHMSKFAGKVRVYDNTKALMEFRKAMKERHNADPDNQWYKYMEGKVTDFGLTGLDKSTVKRLHKKVMVWLCDRCYKISSREGAEVLRIYPVMEGNWIVRNMGNGMWRVDAFIHSVYFHDHDCCELSYQNWAELTNRKTVQIRPQDPFKYDLKNFDIDVVLNGIFNGVVARVNESQDPRQHTPAGERVTWGSKPYRYDDRVRAFLPGNGYGDVLTGEDLERALVRFVYYYVCRNNLMYQFTPDYPRKQWPELPEDRPDDMEFFRFEGCQLENGGFNIDNTDASGKGNGQLTEPHATVTHTLAHHDVAKIEQHGRNVSVSENIDLAGKHLPGTIKIPLETGIAIGVEDDGNNKRILVERGDYIYYEGDANYNDITRMYTHGNPFSWCPTLNVRCTHVRHPARLDDFPLATPSQKLYPPPEHMKTVTEDERGTIMKKCLGIVEAGAKEAATREERNGVRGRIMDVLEVLVESSEDGEEQTAQLDALEAAIRNMRRKRRNDGNTTDKSNDGDNGGRTSGSSDPGFVSPEKGQH
jgi:hypothetical protein